MAPGRAIFGNIVFTKFSHISARFGCEQWPKSRNEGAMTMILQISFDEIVGSMIACLILREALILTLPDRIAGPGGWLINTRKG